MADVGELTIADEGLTAWFLGHIPDAETPLRLEPIIGGRSNLTFAVSDASGRIRWALRRPPLGPVLATAHDMKREYRIVSGLAGSRVPVAPVLGLGSHDGVDGADFYVMEFLHGHVLRDADSAERLLAVPARRTLGHNVVDVLADIHAADPEAYGLGDLGRRDRYVERQLRRWHRQMTASVEQSGRSDAGRRLTSIHDQLLSRVPAQQSSTLVHGDYRLDNCMVNERGDVLAVLDWELCTLGDPLADLGLLLVYWTEESDRLQALPEAPTTAAGFPSRADLIARYGLVSGRDTSQIDFYVGFGYWKLACILEGVVLRYSTTSSTIASEDPATMARQADSAAELAWDLVSRF